ncbi:MAG: MFS transporter [Bacteroidota bacterium]
MTFLHLMAIFRRFTGNSIITRSILLVSMVSFFNDIGSEMLYPVMPVFLRSIGFSVLLIGLLEGMAEATAGISKGYFGNLSDKTGRRVPFVRFGYLLSALAKPMMAAFTWVWWIFVARTTDRLGKGIRTSARDALLSDETSPENKGRVFGFHRAFDTLGAAIGPMLALLYLHFRPGEYKLLFIIALLPGLVSVFITLFLHEKKKERPVISVRPGFFSFLSYRHKAPLPYKMLIGGLLAFTLFNSSDAFLLLGLKEQGVSDTTMIGYYIFYNLVYALVAFPVGILADRLGLYRTLISGLILFSVVYTGMGFASGMWVFGLLFMLYGIYAAATEGVSKALITNISRKEDTATALGFYNALSSIFTMLASTLAGLIWFNFGSAAMFIVSGAGVTLTAIYLAWARRKYQLTVNS